MLRFLPVLAALSLPTHAAELPLPAFPEALNPAAVASCNQAVNPHGFACANETFFGHLFPIAWMNGGIVVGPWTLLTYSDVNDRPGPEFRVLVNPQNPRIPEGVVNAADGTKTGLLDWTPQAIRFNNWGKRGNSLLEVVNRTQIIDPQTIEIFLHNNAGNSQGFQCRMFLRNNNDHLLCRWFSIVNNKAILRGYLGFLRTH